MWETWVQSLGQEDPLEKEMEPHSNILAWRIPWTEALWVAQSRTRLSHFTFTRIGYQSSIYPFSQFSSLSQLCPTLQPHGLQHARLPCPSPTPGDCSNSCPLGWWCHPTISSSVFPFSSCLQPFPASGSFPMSQFLISGGQSIGASASASVLPMNIQDSFPLGLTGLISLQPNRLSWVFSAPQTKCKPTTSELCS